MTARHLMMLGTAAGALAAASPALAQGQPGAEMTYEYAHSAPQTEAEVIYRRQPVVQPVPAYDEYEGEYVDEDEQAYGADYDADYDYETAPQAVPYPSPQARPPMHHGDRHHVRGDHNGGHHAAGYPQQGYDREAWLEECRSRYRGDRRGNRGRRDGGVIGGLVGAAAGGLIGNRIADGDRLAGTLIGAGVGGLAGVAVGSAVGSSSDRSRGGDYCEQWLERYSSGYGYQNYHYGYVAAPVMYVRVLVPVPQRAIVRETVTEEWVEEEVQTYRPVPTKRRVIHRPATKRIKTQPVTRTKYIKRK